MGSLSFAVWENCIAGGSVRSCLSPRHDFGCVGPLRVCLHQTYLLRCVCVSECVFFQLFSLHLCVSNTCGWLMFMFFCKMLVLGCVFVCAGPIAQYHSHSLWSLRGSPPPALPPVSALFGAPGLQWLHSHPDFLIKSTSSSLFPKIWLPFPIWVGFPWCRLGESGWCTFGLAWSGLSLINDSWAGTF